MAYRYLEQPRVVQPHQQLQLVAEGRIWQLRAHVEQLDGDGAQPRQLAPEHAAHGALAHLPSENSF